MEKSMKKKKVDMNIVYEEEPDWDSLNVYPMSQAASKKYASNVWDYFGHLMRGTSCIDNKNFYCLPCFRTQKLKQYSASTATSNFYTHLKAYHSIMPERGVTHKRKSNTIKSEPQQQNEERQPQYDIGQFTEVLDNDALNELIVVGRTNQVKEDQHLSVETTENIVMEPFPKRKFAPQRRSTIRDRKLPIAYINQSYTPKTSMKIIENERNEDYDRLFILSLVKEFRKVPEEYRLDAKYDLLGVLRKYQQIAQSQSLQQIAEVHEEQDESRQEELVTSEKFDHVEQYS
ncbi:uncharacterized protein LOC129609703 [Condylostylus longicornis]|uniref:uncharacterized protein LOC129609703 n=1 Tax=Condylostylus longicornis TaxID=2530218 RepID=UPI00244E183E|nr:uncharacterized protein LOC129609703 [Condylostylus longicornis]